MNCLLCCLSVNLPRTCSHHQASQIILCDSLIILDNVWLIKHHIFREFVSKVMTTCIFFSFIMHKEEKYLLCEDLLYAYPKFYNTNIHFSCISLQLCWRNMLWTWTLLNTWIFILVSSTYILVCKTDNIFSMIIVSSLGYQNIKILKLI